MRMEWIDAINAPLLSPNIELWESMTDVIPISVHLLQNAINPDAIRPIPSALVQSFENYVEFQRVI